MKVYFDIVLNHTGDVIAYAEGTFTYRNKANVPYRDAAGSRSTTATTPAATLPASSTRRELPVHPDLPDGGRRHRQGAGLAERPDAVPQPRRLDVRRRELALRRLLRSRRPLHRAPRRRRRDDRHPHVDDRQFDIDGFRVDTVKHVNDELWEEFVPRRPGTPRARATTTSPSSARSSTATRRSCRASRPSCRSRRRSTSASSGTVRASSRRRRRPTACATLFADDDWFTDADSNAYSLTKFVGNHDIGRIGNFVRPPTPAPTDAELLARDRLAHVARLTTTRGLPGRLLRRRAGLHRRRRRPGRAPGHVPDAGRLVQRRRPDRHGRDHGRRQLRPDASALPGARRARRAAGRPSRAARGRPDPPLLSERAPGIYAFSPHRRTTSRSSTSSRSTTPRRRSRRRCTDVLERDGLHVRLPAAARRPTTDASGRLPLTVPALSAVVYRAARAARRRARATRS